MQVGFALGMLGQTPGQGFAVPEAAGGLDGGGQGRVELGISLAGHEGQPGLVGVAGPNQAGQAGAGLAQWGRAGGQKIIVGQSLLGLTLVGLEQGGQGGPTGLERLVGSGNVPPAKMRGQGHGFLGRARQVIETAGCLEVGTGFEATPDLLGLVAGLPDSSLPEPLGDLIDTITGSLPGSPVPDPDLTPAFIDRLRGELREYANAHIVIKEFENGPPIDAPIAIRVLGSELGPLKALAAEVEGIISSVPGTRDVDNPLRLDRTDLKLNLDSEKAALLGVPSVEFDRAVRLAVSGVDAGDYRDESGESYDIVVRSAIDGRPTLEQLDQVRVPSLSGALLPASQLARLEFERSPPQIQRSVSMAWTPSSIMWSRAPSMGCGAHL